VAPGAGSHVKSGNVIKKSGLDLAIQFLEMIRVARRYLTSCDEGSDGVQIHTDYLAAEAKSLDDRYAAAAEGIQNDAAGVGVVLNECPKDAPRPAGEIAVHLVNGRVRLGDDRMVNGLEVVEVLDFLGHGGISPSIGRA